MRAAAARPAIARRIFFIEHLRAPSVEFMKLYDLAKATPHELTLPRITQRAQALAATNPPVAGRLTRTNASLSTEY